MLYKENDQFHLSVKHEPLLRVLRSTTHHYVGARVTHSVETPDLEI